MDTPDTTAPVVEHRATRAFRRARFDSCDLSGAVFRDCDLSGARITSSLVDDLRVDGFDGAAGSVVVDGVDVSGYVAAELDRRFPERVQVKEASTADELRAAWTTVQGLWEQTLGEASSRREVVLHERVEGEWSFVDTLRHLVFAVDCWVGRMLTESDRPFDPLGLPPSDHDRAQLPAMGLDPDREVALDVVVPVLRRQWEAVREAFAEVEDVDLEQPRTARVVPGEVETVTVRHCLRVVLNEHAQHRRFAVRDLRALPPG